MNTVNTSVNFIRIIAIVLTMGCFLCPTPLIAEWQCKEVQYENFSSTYSALYRENTEYYQIDGDINGNMLLVWPAYVDTFYNVRLFKSEYKGGAWSRPANVSDYINPDDPDGSKVANPRVAVSDGGDAIIVWSQQDGSAGTYHVYMSEYRNGQWSHPHDLSDHISPEGSDYGHVYPRVAIDTLGNAIVVWVCNFKLFKHEYRNETWTTEQIQINENPSADRLNVAMNRSGNAIITWNDYVDVVNPFDRNQIFVAEYKNDSWHFPGPYDYISPDGMTEISYSYEDLKAAMSDNGDVIIVWKRNSKLYMSDRRTDVWAHPADMDDYFNPDSTKIENYILDNLFKGTTLAMNASGDTLVTWAQGVSSLDPDFHARIYISQYSNGEWHHPVDLDDNLKFICGDACDYYHPYVAMNDVNASLVYRNYIRYDSPPGPGMQYSIYKNSTWLHPNSAVYNTNSQSLRFGGAPMAVMLNNTEELFIWSSATDGEGVFHKCVDGKLKKFPWELYFPAMLKPH